MLRSWFYTSYPIVFILIEQKQQVSVQKFETQTQHFHYRKLVLA